jgi:Protein of unknown function (DUF3311)
MSGQPASATCSSDSGLAINRFIRILLAGIPIAALSVAVPFVNHVEPRILGLPFVLAWIAGWVVVTPAFLWTLGRVERHW